MLIPASIDLPDILVGGTWETELQFWEDAAHTIPFNLTGYTVLLVIASDATLAEGSGLTVTKATGLVAVAQTATATAALTVRGGVHYKVILTKGAEVLYPVHGTVKVVDP